MQGRARAHTLVHAKIGFTGVCGLKEDEKKGKKCNDAQRDWFHCLLIEIGFQMSMLEQRSVDAEKRKAQRERFSC